MTESTEPTRELEFLDVYNDTQPHKITYSIEPMSGPPNSGDFILTENSGTFTLTQNTKLENTSSNGSVKIDDGDVEEEEVEDDDNDNDEDDDDVEDAAVSVDADGTEVDEPNIIEEYSESGGDPLIVLPSTTSELEETVIHTNGAYTTTTTTTTAAAAAAAANSTTNTLLHITPKIKTIKIKPRQQQNIPTNRQQQQPQQQHHHHHHHYAQQHAQLQRALENTLEVESATDPISILKTSSNDSYNSVSEIHQLHENAIDQAVQAVLTEGMSLQKAAQKYVISKTVLWRRVRKHPNYMKTSRENPVLKLAYERLKEGDSLKNISRDLDIPMSTLHRHKVRLAQQGRLPKYIAFKKRDSMTKDELKEKLSKAVHACVHDGMSQNKSANLYDIPKSTLWRHLQKRVAEAELNKQRNNVEIKEEIILS